MKLSTKARYGMRAMVDLALHYGQGPVLLKDMARRQEVSMKYLDHIIQTLKTHGLIQNVKTRHGGYVLSKSPSQTKAYEVIQAVEGPLVLAECINDPNICERSDFCVTIDLWKRLGESMATVLQETTLEDLAKRQKKKGEQAKKTLMYYI